MNDSPSKRAVRAFLDPMWLSPVGWVLVGAMLDQAWNGRPVLYLGALAVIGLGAFFVWGSRRMQRDTSDKQSPTA